MAIQGIGSINSIVSGITSINASDEKTEGVRFGDIL
jgi:hypothetical protein